jgi:hypothetical protein
MIPEETAVTLLLKAIMIRLGVNHITIPENEAHVLHGRARGFELEIVEEGRPHTASTTLHIYLKPRR